MATMSFRAVSSPATTRVLVGFAGVVAVVCIAASVVQAGRFAQIAWRLHDRPEQPARVNDIDPLAYFASTAALAGARQVIPPDATYAIVVGKVPDPELIRIVFRLWLVPRHFTAEPRDADWVVVYNAPSEGVGVPYSREIGVAANVNVLEVRR